MLNNLGLSSVKICTVLPYFAGEQGCSQKQPYFRFAFGHRYFARCLAASYPSLCIRKPILQIGTPSSSMVKIIIISKMSGMTGIEVDKRRDVFSPAVFIDSVSIMGGIQKEFFNAEFRKVCLHGEKGMEK